MMTASGAIGPRGAMIALAARTGGIELALAVRIVTVLVACAAMTVSSGAGGADEARWSAPAAAPKFREWAVPAPKMIRDPFADRDDSVVFAVAHDDRIVRFDARSQQFTDWKLPAGSRPHGIGVARDGHVFFGGHGRGTIGELDPSTGNVREYATSGTDTKPYSLALDPAGNVWATLRGADKIAKLDRATGRVTEYPVAGEPYGLAFDAQGAVWVSCIRSGSIAILDPASGRVQDIGTGTGSRPRRIAIGPDGSVWVTLYGTGRLLRADSRTRRPVREYPLPGGENAGPYSVAVDRHGRVWINEFQTDSVLLFNPATERFQSARLPMRDSGVRNATLDAKGRFWYLASTHGRIGVVE